MDNKEILKGFADNRELFETVKKVVLQKFSIDRLTEKQNDIELGQTVRARLVGLQAVEEAFKEIAQYKSVPDMPDRINPAK